MAITTGRSGSGLTIDVDHLEDVRQGLNEFDPQVRLALDRTIRRSLQSVAAEAAGTLHDGPGGGRRQYRVERRKGGYRLINRDRGATISEFAGSRNPQGLTPRGRTLIATLDAAYGKPGRIAWAAWDRRREQVDREIVAALAVAERELDARLGRL